MKSLRIFGWAAIFTVTLLLAACASQRAGLAGNDMTSGPDTSISQSEDKELTLERQMNALNIHEAWLDEREARLRIKEDQLDYKENALAINQAWLNERETRLDHQAADLTAQDDMLAFKGVWFDQEGTAAGSPVRVESGRCYASVVIPAEYKTVAVVKPIEVPEGEHLPVLYQTVTEKVKVTDETTRWEEILCENELTDCRILEIQRALYRGGYNPGPIDGIVGQQTMAAVKAFQKDFNLTVADSLTVETVNALDANF